MVAGPEVARMVTAFEALQAQKQVTDHRHHEPQPGVQTTVLKDMKSLSCDRGDRKPIPGEK